MSQLFGGVSLKDLVVLTLRQVLRTWNKNIAKNKQDKSAPVDPYINFNNFIILEGFFEDSEFDEDDFENDIISPDIWMIISKRDLWSTRDLIIDKHFENLLDRKTGRKRRRIALMRTRSIFSGVMIKGDMELGETLKAVSCGQILNGDTVVIFRASEYKQGNMADIIPFPVKGK